MKHDFDQKLQRYQFPALKHGVYFNHAGVAPISGVASDALIKYAQEASNCAYFGWGWYARCKQIKQNVAKLIGAVNGSTIAFVPNTSSGLSLVANGIAWVHGDSVVITDAEYPANRYVWQNLEAKGVKLIIVKQDANGIVDPRDVCDAIENKTRIVAISHVQYASGYRIELKKISEQIHKAGGYLCVDAIQSVGVLPVDVKAMGIDFLAADGHKWMLGPEGAGIFYCDPDLLEWLKPSVVGWLNMVDPYNFGDYNFEFSKTAQRFEPGTYNISGNLAIGASVDMLLELGIDNISERVLGLTDHLCEMLEAKGYTICSPRQQEYKSGIVVFEKQGLDKTSAVISKLEKEKIIIVLREGKFRASPHFYNTFEQIDQLVSLLP